MGDDGELAKYEDEGRDIALCLEVFEGVLYDLALSHRDGIAVYIALQSYATVFRDDILGMADPEARKGIENVIASTTKLVRERVPRIYERRD